MYDQVGSSRLLMTQHTHTHTAAHHPRPRVFVVSPQGHTLGRQRRALDDRHSTKCRWDPKPLPLRAGRMDLYSSSIDQSARPSLQHRCYNGVTALSQRND